MDLKDIDSIPIRNTILLWVANFRATELTLKRKSIGLPMTARTPATVDAVNASIQHCMRCCSILLKSTLFLISSSFSLALRKVFSITQYCSEVTVTAYHCHLRKSMGPKCEILILRIIQQHKDYAMGVLESHEDCYATNNKNFVC